MLLGYINNLLLLDSSTTEEIYAFLVFIDICLYIFRIAVYINMKKFNSTGYYMNMGLIISECIYYSANQFVLGGLLQFLSGGIVFGLIWGVPNIIYFKKRKFLFMHDAEVIPSKEIVDITDDTDDVVTGYDDYAKDYESFDDPAEVALQEPAVEPETADPIPDRPVVVSGDGSWICPHCNKRTNRGWKFCNFCGYEPQFENAQNLKNAIPPAKSKGKAPSKHKRICKYLKKQVYRAYDKNLNIFVHEIRQKYKDGMSDQDIAACEQSYYAAVYENVCDILQRRSKKLQNKYLIKSLVESNCGYEIDRQDLTPWSIFAFAYWVMADETAAQSDLNYITDYAYTKQNEVFSALGLPTHPVGEKPKSKPKARKIISITVAAVVLTAGITLGIIFIPGAYYDYRHDKLSNTVYARGGVYHLYSNCTSFKDSANYEITTIEEATSPKHGYSSCWSCRNRGAGVYITATGDCYHKANCSTVKSKKKYMDVVDAILQGYKPCSKCDPPAKEIE